jgi:hypothetical protein
MGERDLAAEAAELLDTERRERHLPVHTDDEALRWRALQAFRRHPWSPFVPAPEVRLVDEDGARYVEVVARYRVRPDGVLRRLRSKMPAPERPPRKHAAVLGPCRRCGRVIRRHEFYLTLISAEGLYGWTCGDCLTATETRFVLSHDEGERRELAARIVDEGRERRADAAASN